MRAEGTGFHKSETFDDEVLTVADVAQMLNVRRKAVWKWIEDGKLKAYRTPGGHRRILRSDFDTAMRAINPGNWP